MMWPAYWRVAGWEFALSNKHLLVSFIVVAMAIWMFSGEFAHNTVTADDEVVLDQGDERPMDGNPGAMGDLRRILMAREAHYARADLSVDTGGRNVRDSLEDLLRVLA